MKRLHFHSLILLVLMSTPVLGFKISFALDSYDFIVPDDYPSIQEAINAAEQGHSIYVRGGIYQEYLIISKSVSITGENASTTLIEGNGTQVLVEITADNVSFSGFTLKDAETGILLNEVENCRIEGNIIESMSVWGISTGGIGIYASNCENIVVSENLMNDIYYNAVYFKSTRNSQIVRNTLIANGRWSQPVILVSSEKNLIGWNEVLGLPEMNEGGIGLLYSNYNTICYNDIHENDWCGISLRASNHTIVKGNNIMKHSWWGIMIKYSHNITIYYNNFIDNTIQLFLESIKNITWNHENCGNFWSDYAGNDENNDGIGDTPYMYKGKEVDHYPLMGKFNWFEVKKEESYHANVISNFTINAFEFKNDTIKMCISHQKLDFTIGFFRLCIPKDLISPPYAIIVDNRNKTVPYVNGNLQDTSAHRWIYFTCEYSVHEVIIMNTFPTDLDSDGIVGIDDIFSAAEAFGSYLGHSRWNSDADVNKDNSVDIRDLVTIAKDFGKQLKI